MLTCEKGINCTLIKYGRVGFGCGVREGVSTKRERSRKTPLIWHYSWTLKTGSTLTQNHIQGRKASGNMSFKTYFYHQS
jgi:hypothetical protein